MTIHVGAVEAIWLGVNLVAIVLTFGNLNIAWADREAVKRANGRAREIAANSDVRRESLRLVMLLCLTGVAVPSIFSAREIMLTPALISLMAVPFIVFLQSALDARERRQLIAVLQHKQADE